MSARSRALPVIRPALAADLDALAGIEHRAFQSDRISRRSFSRLIGSPSTGVLVCERDGRPAGYALVLFRSNSRIARLYSIAVLPDFAGAGLGAALLRAAEGLAAASGSSQMGLEVRTDNDPAIRLYREAGYRLAGTKDRYYADGAAAYRLAKPFGKPQAESAAAANLRSGISAAAGA